MKRVMIVDDAAFTRMMLRNIFESLGLKVVVEAANGEEAIKQFKMYRPDLVTMDISMPNMDGLTAVKKIIEIDQRANIVVCSATGQRDIVIKAIAAGAKDYIMKPLHKDRVEISVRQLLSLDGYFKYQLRETSMKTEGVFWTEGKQH